MISTTDISGYVADLLRDAIPSDTTFDVISPIDGSLIASVPDCGEAQARQALDQSERAFETWKRTTAYERAAVMKRWHTLIAEHEAALAHLMTLEMGKPINESIGEVHYGNSMVEWYAEEAKRVGGESIPSQHPRKRLYTMKQPTGIVYAITPWNFPIAIVLRKLAPALAAGCTVILKPAEQTPLSSLALAKLWREAGGAPDALQVLPALDPRPVSQVLLADMRVRVLTFTGSTAVGMLLYQQSARTMKRVALELGGHAPFLIFDDADIDLAIQDVVACKFRNGGQTCVCTPRIYVQEAIAGEFTRRCADAVGALRVGNPLD
ncbi:MAG: aldehyde dehydrogenase family protein, partial [Anaerolineae bacterium]|nr:aldehyde dehydrogenase family protein [Anaerolineae bacterium]